MIKQQVIGADSAPIDAVGAPFRIAATSNGTEAGVAKPNSPNGMAVRTLVGFDGTGAPRIDSDQSAPMEALSARTIVPLGTNQIGQQVVVQFEGGDAHKPIVMGVLRSTSASPIHIAVDGERLLLTADREIVLRCGEASITLTQAGKVILRGTYLLNRSTGVNQIKGGSVQIN